MPASRHVCECARAWDVKREHVSPKRLCGPPRHRPLQTQHAPAAPRRSAPVACWCTSGACTSPGRRCVRRWCRSPSSAGAGATNVRVSPAHTRSAALTDRCERLSTLEVLPPAPHVTSMNSGPRSYMRSMRSYKFSTPCGFERWDSDEGIRTRHGEGVRIRRRQAQAKSRTTG